MKKQTLVRFIAGETTDDEAAEVLRWINASDANRSYFCELKNTWVVASMPSGNATSAQMAELRSQGYYKKPRSIKRFIPAVAAAAIIPLLALNLYLMLFQKKDVGQLIQHASKVTYSTNKGVKGMVTLPDGSRVWLNSDSRISFPERFSGKTREVLFSGEGFFDVKKNPDMPMVVSTQKGIKVRVTGTEFNLASYNNDEMLKATLYEGKIALITKDKTSGKEKTYDVKPLETATIYATNTVYLKPTADTVTCSAWRNGNIIFENEVMPEVLKKLERWHGVEFVIKDKRILSYSFTAKFKSESIVQIMEILSFCSPIAYSIKENVVTLDLPNS